MLVLTMVTTMPKSIKPKMSNDLLAPFDSQISDIVYDDGCVEIKLLGDDLCELLFDEKDLEAMLSFLRSNKMKEKK